MMFGWWAALQLGRISAGKNLDCFMDLGAFEVCHVTQHLSIYSTLFLLTSQALISRIVVPGMSIFVNASVRQLLMLEPKSIANVIRFVTVQEMHSHTPQILHSESSESREPVALHET